MSLLLSDYLIASESDVQPEGVFIVDSPVALLGLYENSLRNIERNFSTVSVQESEMIIGLLEPEFGKPENSIKKYEEHSVYTAKTNNIDNLIFKTSRSDSIPNPISLGGRRTDRTTTKT